MGIMTCIVSISRPTVLHDGARWKVGHLYLFVVYCTWCPTHPANQGKVTPSPRDPFFQLPMRPDPPLILKGVTESSLVPASCFFPPSHPPSKIPDIPAISGAMFTWQNECSGGDGGGGRASCIEKEPHSQTVWASLEGKHVQEGCVRPVVKELRPVCSGLVHLNRAHREALCSLPNCLGPTNILLPPLVCSRDGNLLLVS